MISDHKNNFVKLPGERSTFFIISDIFLFSLKPCIRHVWTDLKSVIFGWRKRL